MARAIQVRNCITVLSFIALMPVFASACVTSGQLHDRFHPVGRIIRGADRVAVHSAFLKFFLEHHFDVLREDEAHGLITARYEFPGTSTTCSAAFQLSPFSEPIAQQDFGVHPSVTVEMLVSDDNEGAKVLVRAQFETRVLSSTKQLTDRLPLKSTLSWEHALINSVFPSDHPRSNKPLIHRVSVVSNNPAGLYIGEITNHSAVGAPVTNCITVSIFRAGARVSGSWITMTTPRSIGPLSGDLVENAITGLHIIQRGLCSSEFRGAATLEETRQQLTGQAMGQDCHGPATISFTLDRQ